MNTIISEKRVAAWVRIGLGNLLLVSLWGLLMRYKIVFSLPFFNQKYLLHAHSHFAFGGWVSLMLMVLMLRALPAEVPASYSRKFHRLLVAWLVSAYGMLISFTLQGYALWSITFSTASVLLSFLFAGLYFNALRSVPSFPGSRWFKAALIWNVISTGGTFSLSYLMATHTANQEAYLGSIYWYLHFQYNGWFFFACMGLLIHYLHGRGIVLPGESGMFKLFAYSCLPAYGLSVLWLNLPVPVALFIAATAVAQVVGLAILLRGLFLVRQSIAAQLSWLPGALLLTAGLAFTLKILLQLASADPALSTLAFGSRTVVITYLHLVLLVGVSLLLIGLVVAEGILPVYGAARLGLLMFSAGVVMNELLLAVQSVGALFYIPIPAIFESLLAVSAVMSVGLIMLNAGCAGLRKRATSLVIG
ncbi:hypothetical protein WJU16_25555 [Chitinophaga pollutisoli]|uniref:Uncharacterized protein n=1 Tax=Chitinophaga pollutisoli TaxID=3133966 RepID=A0ABZ2YPB9_9BACT